jgi:hypothetical protein
MRRISVCSTLAALAGFLAGSSVLAQPAPAAASPTPNAATASFSSANSNHGRGIGVGAMTMLNGTSGALFTWGSAGGGFHIDGMAGLHRYRPGGAPSSTTDFTLAGRFWYHIHSAAYADFSLGGGFGIIRWVSNPGAGNESDNLDVCFEVGGQIRAFIVPNVALTADLGLGATFGSNDNILIGGQSFTGSGSPEGGSGFVAGTLGIAYFFE